MASGHANRAKRPNTWLHRPATQRQVLTCQPGAVHTWHLADMLNALTNVRFWGQSDSDQPLLINLSIYECTTLPPSRLGPS